MHKIMINRLNLVPHQKHTTGIRIWNQQEYVQTQRLTLHSIIDWNVEMIKLKTDKQLMK